MYCSNCGKEIQDGAAFCHYCGKPLTPVPAAEVAPVRGMRWHKFLIYFALFVSALLNLSDGVRFLTGASYGEMADQIYGMYSLLKTLDIVYGVLLIIVAVYIIVTRFSLAKFKVNGPLMLLLLYICLPIFSIIYLVAGAAVIGVSFSAVMTPSILGSICGSLVMLVIDWIYYNKRKHLFVN